MKNLIPIYFLIKQSIKGWIINKEYGPGEKIPSESELVERFKVNRLTVRQAIQQLVQEGFLISERGKGTFVTENVNIPNRFSLEFTGFMDNLFFEQIAKVKVKSASVSFVPPTRSIREKLELPKEEKEVVELRRIRLQGDQPFTFTINYLPLEYGRRIKKQLLYKKPLLEILEHDLRLHFTEAVETIEASFASQEVAKALAIPEGSPMLFVERIMYGPKRKPIELFQCFYRGDMYHFIVRFKNIGRKKRNNWIRSRVSSSSEQVREGK